MLFLSVSFNIYFTVSLILQIKKNEEQKSIRNFKNINYEDGYVFFKSKVENDGYLSLSNDRINLVYFWDSLYFDDIFKLSMSELDSLMFNSYMNKFNCYFVTEMEENATNKFLKKKNIHYKSFKVIAGMDYFMSSVYNKFPLKWKKVKVPFDTIKSEPNKNTPKNTIKLKPAYFLINSDGEMLFHTYKYWLPLKDTSFMSKLTQLSINKKNILN